MTQSIQQINAHFERQATRMVKGSATIQGSIQSFMTQMFLSVIDNESSWGSINTLYQGINGTATKDSIRHWVINHTPLRFDKKKGVFLRTKEKAWNRAVLEQAVPYWEYKKAVPVRSQLFDREKKVNSLVKQMEKLLAEFNSNNADATALEAAIRMLKD